MNEKEQSDFEQSVAAIAESYPPMWRRMYLNLLSEGFSKDESMDLLKTFILSMART